MAPSDRAQRRAQEHADALHREILAHPDAVPSGAARALANVLAVLVVVSTVALVPFAIWLFIALPAKWMGAILGAIVLGVVWTIRPRRPRIPDDAVTVTTTPALTALIADVAASVGTRAPRTVAIAPVINAMVFDGPRRQGRVLLIGAPLWLALAPQSRVALLAHELGHFASGDTRRTTVVSAAFSVLSGWRDLLRSGGGVRGSFGWGGEAGAISDISISITRVVFWLVGSVPLVLGWALIHLTSRDSQRAEYRADRTASRVGGRDATIHMLVLLERGAALDTALQRAAIARVDTLEAARTFDPSATPAPASLVQHHRPDPFDSHPPTPYRLEAVLAQPLATAAVVLDSSRAAAVEAELAPAFAKIERRIRDSYLG